jgi:hypothetical protein
LTRSYIATPYLDLHSIRKRGNDRGGADAIHDEGLVLGQDELQDEYGAHHGHHHHDEACERVEIGGNAMQCDMT